MREKYEEITKQIETNIKENKDYLSVGNIINDEVRLEKDIVLLYEQHNKILKFFN